MECKISYIPNAAMEEAERLKFGDLGDAWFKSDAVMVRIYDAADDRVLGPDLNRGWFAEYRPVRIVNLNR